MAVTNNVDWHWLIEESGLLTLQLTEQFLFQTPFKQTELTSNCQSGSCFTTSDAFVYSLHRDKFAPLPISEEHAFTLAVCATVSTNYLKPMANKSWYFKEASSDLSKPVHVGDWVSLNTSEEAIYLVLNTDTTASDVMLVSKSHRIDEQRQFKMGKPVRVHNDRLSPVYYELQEHQL